MNQRTVLRRCVACRTLFDRQKLWKVTRDFQDGIVLDKGMGRSAYICPKKECFEEALRRKRLQKALRCQVPLTVFDLLQNRLNENKHSNSEER
ncbi:MULTISPECIES: YlxR family protein [Prochlorococcus]|uniref:YlxR family protein n=1 Tax=Prochlorococcus TaxID=1218 RepID=UPI00056C2647|nr:MULTISPECIES: YlxR family protein [Prochlorococcus]